ncbi:MAG: choice-of-anchor E domain-containing protein, partial [Ginsengibacter sp.]
MKNLYLIISGLVISLFIFTESNAQCTCSDGSIPDSVQYSQYFDSIIANNNVLSFPQFNPDSGSLQCIRLSDTVTTVVSYNMQNDLDYVEDYVFETFRRSRFEGPGSYVNSITSAPQEYGPYTLQPRDSVGDNISIGPDTVFNKQYQSKYGPPNAAYYGTGTVNFNYLTTSTFTILTGSDNAVFKLSSYTRLFVTLTYYWCPSAILSARVSNFTATNGGDHISLGWESDH